MMAMAYQPSQWPGMPNQRVQEMLELLCLFFPQFDLGLLHDYCATHSKEDVLQASGEIRRYCKFCLCKCPLYISLIEHSSKTPNQLSAYVAVLNPLVYFI